MLNHRRGRLGLVGKVLLSFASLLDGCKDYDFSGDYKHLETSECKEMSGLIADKAGPFRNFGIYGSEVWIVDFDNFYGSELQNAPPPRHGTYFNDALVITGLRRQTPITDDEKEANAVTKALVEHAVLGRMAENFGNNEDGSPAPGGLAVSFLPSCDLRAGFFRFNRICLGRLGGYESKYILGMAYDDPGNREIEHNCSTEEIFLGISVVRWAEMHASFYSNDTATRNVMYSPLSGQDLGILWDLFYGVEMPGSKRAMDIKDAINNAGCSLGDLLSHEVGHSLGATHRNSAGETSIMYPAFNTRPGMDKKFSDENWSILEANVGVN